MLPFHQYHSPVGILCSHLSSWSLTHLSFFFSCQYSAVLANFLRFFAGTVSDGQNNHWWLCLQLASELADVCLLCKLRKVFPLFFPLEIVTPGQTVVLFAWCSFIFLLVFVSITNPFCVFVSNVSLRTIKPVYFRTKNVASVSFHTWQHHLRAPHQAIAAAKYEMRNILWKDASFGRLVFHAAFQRTN